MPESLDRRVVMNNSPVHLKGIIFLPVHIRGSCFSCWDSVLGIEVFYISEASKLLPFQDAVWKSLFDINFDSLLQFALWVDAVIFVFSLEDENSFQTVYHYFSRLASYRNPADLPLVLVGTQGETRTPTGTNRFCGLTAL